MCFIIEPFISLLSSFSTVFNRETHTHVPFVHFQFERFERKSKWELSLSRWWFDGVFILITYCVLFYVCCYCLFNVAHVWLSRAIFVIHGNIQHRVRLFEKQIWMARQWMTDISIKYFLVVNKFKIMSTESCCCCSFRKKRSIRAKKKCTNYFSSPFVKIKRVLVINYFRSCGRSRDVSLGDLYQFDPYILPCYSSSHDRHRN